MLDHQEAMVKSLVAVAWADGRVENEESEVVSALIDSFGLGKEDAATIREFAKTPKTIDDVPLTELSADDRRILLHHAVVVTYIDGTQSDQERAVLAKLVEKLRIPADEAKELLAAADARAQQLVKLL